MPGRNDKLREKFLALRQELNGRLYERGEVVLGLLIALLSREHVFVLGRPGTAKSLLIRKLYEAISGAQYFEWLLTKFTQPDEVFGPASIAALKRDEFQRKTAGKLPEAHFAFMDEIFKANSSILNALLSIINERVFHNNGHPVKVPLETILSASNELPEEDGSEQLEALWDRFLVRFHVDRIQEDSNFMKLLSSNDVPMPGMLSLDEIHAAQAEVVKVDIPKEVFELVVKLRARLETEGFEPSDRRFHKCMTLVRAHAWMEGRTEAVSDDLMALQWALWNKPDDIRAIRDILIDVANPVLMEVQEKVEALHGALKEAKKVQQEFDAKSIDEVAFSAKLIEYHAKARQQRDAIKNIMNSMAADGKSVSSVKEAFDSACSIVEDIEKLKWG